MSQKFGINDLLTAKVTVTAAQILAMFGAPVTVLAAPALNKVILVEPIHVQFVPGSVNFLLGGAVNFVYHGGAVVPHGGSIPAATLLSGTGSNNLLSSPAAVIQPPVGTGIDITNATQAFTAGNGTLILTIWYALLRIG